MNLNLEEELPKKEQIKPKEVIKRLAEQLLKKQTTRKTMERVQKMTRKSDCTNLNI